jgi:hypothetical protein
VRLWLVTVDYFRSLWYHDNTASSMETKKTATLFHLIIEVPLIEGETRPMLAEYRFGQVETPLG